LYIASIGNVGNVRLFVGDILGLIRGSLDVGLSVGN